MLELALIIIIVVLVVIILSAFQAYRWNRKVIGYYRWTFREGIVMREVLFPSGIEEGLLEGILSHTIPEEFREVAIKEITRGHSSNSSCSVIIPICRRFYEEDEKNTEIIRSTLNKQTS
jgi:hypothetical protein